MDNLGADVVPNKALLTFCPHQGLHYARRNGPNPSPRFGLFDLIWFWWAGLVLVGRFGFGFGGPVWFWFWWAGFGFGGLVLVLVGRFGFDFISGAGLVCASPKECTAPHESAKGEPRKKFCRPNCHDPAQNYRGVCICAGRRNCRRGGGCCASRVEQPHGHGAGLPPRRLALRHQRGHVHHSGFSGGCGDAGKQLRF